MSNLCYGYKVHKPKEVESMKPFIEEAKAEWARLAKETYERSGDQGSCVIGDGIKIYWIPPRCKLPRERMIIASNEVSHCQGSLHYEAHADTILKRLRANGIDAHYCSGRMD